MKERYNSFLVGIFFLLALPAWYNKPVYAREKFSRPSAGTISSVYGPRKGLFHTGIDFLPDKGREVVAARGGLVVYASTKGNYGKTVIIYHGNTIYTWYGHLSDFKVDVGDSVEEGQQIADMGSSGKSTNTHLHFEIRIGRQHVNPADYLKRPLPRGSYGKNQTIVQPVKHP